MKLLKAKIFVFWVFVLVAVVLATAFYFYKNGYFSDVNIKKVQAASQELGGFAWSSNIGWISFNCLDGSVCATSNYKVVYDDANGNMGGYAWSSNIGWIRFDPGGGYPGSPNYDARINPGTGNVTGWARACAVFDPGLNGIPECGSNDDILKSNYERGGWDGWIKMAGTASDGSPYGLKFDNTSGKFLQGTAANPYFAWGSDVVGWINLCSDPTNASECVGRVSGALSPPVTATTTPGGRREIPPQ